MRILPEYKRILLKLSGEFQKKSNDAILDINAIQYIVNEIKSIYTLKLEIGVVIGAGNIFRGAFSNDFDRVIADKIGMLSTVINSIALCNKLKKSKIKSAVLSTIEMPAIAELFTHNLAEKYLKEGRVVIFCAGTGHPYFTTDTAAALKAIEINADILFKATKVNGVYDSDPIKNKSAKIYKHISFEKVIEDKLKVMDLTAVSLCMENDLPVNVFDFTKKGSLKNIISGKKIGSLIGGKRK